MNVRGTFFGAAALLGLVLTWSSAVCQTTVVIPVPDMVGTWTSEYSNRLSADLTLPAGDYRISTGLLCLTYESTPGVIDPDPPEGNPQTVPAILDLVVPGTAECPKGWVIRQFPFSNPPECDLLGWMEYNHDSPCDYPFTQLRTEPFEVQIITTDIVSLGVYWIEPTRVEITSAVWRFTADGTVPVERPSWGAVKVRY